MRLLLASSLLVGSLLALAGCISNQTAAGRAQEAANELNLNSRFGRLEMAAEHVAPAGRTDFIEHRKGWGGKLRIADCDLAGVKITGEDADVFVKVGWYKIDVGELRVTTLRQKWHDFKGEWKLVGEERVEGDVGLIGEKLLDAPPPPRESVQFPTIRLGQAD